MENGHRIHDCPSIKRHCQGKEFLVCKEKAKLQWNTHPYQYNRLEKLRC